MEKNKITLVTMWYNEEYLAPFFLNHYKWVDKIIIYIDEYTTDFTENIIDKSNLNITKKFVKFDNGVDEFKKINTLSNEYHNSETEWFIIVDSDEFLFHKSLNNMKKRIIESGNDYTFVPYYTMYKHDNEPENLNMNIPIWEQREYGVLHHTNDIKPAIVRTGLDIKFSVGHHLLYKDNKIIEKKESDFIGIHLPYLNLEFVKNRLLKNRLPRQSDFNIKHGINTHITSLTEDKINQNYIDGIKNSVKIL
jgi:hypothetical protein